MPYGLIRQVMTAQTFGYLIAEFQCSCNGDICLKDIHVSHGLGDDVVIRHKFVHGGIMILHEALEHRYLVLRFINDAQVHLSTNLIDTFTNKLKKDQKVKYTR